MQPPKGFGQNDVERTGIVGAIALEAVGGDAAVKKNGGHDAEKDDLHHEPRIGRSPRDQMPDEDPRKADADQRGKR